MKYLLDTELLIWIPVDDRRLSRTVLNLLGSAENEFLFSTASLWEIAIKHGLGKPGFPFDPRGIRNRLLKSGYEELPVLGEHVLAVENLEKIHKDPFDRLLIAQATVEGIILLTSDKAVAQYKGPVQRV
jgi:PIN domain nuclease of toxin-antitoxin system